MLIPLPPSETKRSGGSGGPVELAALAFTDLTPVRERTLEALSVLTSDREASLRALKLGPKSAYEYEHNPVVSTSSTMPAIDRFTGVLFDAFDAGSLTESERSFASQNLVVHSALWGPILASDPIPAYRLSHDTRLPGTTLKRLWAKPVTEVLAAHDGLVIDLRSESYVGLGPLPQGEDRVYLRVATRGQDGALRSLNHFNKQAKGRFARSLVSAGEAFSTRTDLLDWAVSDGASLLPSERPGVLDLVVDEI